MPRVAYEYHTTVISIGEMEHYVHCHGEFEIGAEVRTLSGDATYLIDICQELESDINPEDWLEAAPILEAWADKTGEVIKECSTL